jgi:hypothetical protein
VLSIAPGAFQEHEDTKSLPLFPTTEGGEGRGEEALCFPSAVNKQPSTFYRPPMG